MFVSIVCATPLALVHISNLIENKSLVETTLFTNLIKTTKAWRKLLSCCRCFLHLQGWRQVRRTLTHGRSCLLMPIWQKLWQALTHCKMVVLTQSFNQGPVGGSYNADACKKEQDYKYNNYSYQVFHKCVINIKFY